MNVKKVTGDIAFRGQRWAEDEINPVQVPALRFCNEYELGLSN